MLFRYRCIYPSPFLGRILNVAHGRPPADGRQALAVNGQQRVGASSSLISTQLNLSSQLRRAEIARFLCFGTRQHTSVASPNGCHCALSALCIVTSQASRPWHLTIRWTLPLPPWRQGSVSSRCCHETSWHTSQRARPSAPTFRESLFRCKHTRSLPNHVDAWIGRVYIFYIYRGPGTSGFPFGIIAFPSSPRFDFSFYPAIYILFCVCLQPLVRSKFIDIHFCYFKILWKI